PRGRSILAADVTIASVKSNAKSPACSNRRSAAAAIRHIAPVATVMATYVRAIGGSERKSGVLGGSGVIRTSPQSASGGRTPLPSRRYTIVHEMTLESLSRLYGKPDAHGWSLRPGQKLAAEYRTKS